MSLNKTSVDTRTYSNMNVHFLQAINSNWVTDLKFEFENLK